MAKAKAKTKAKLDFKQLLLSKGEYIALGVAGLFTAILLLSGISMWTSAQDPKKIATGLKTSADQVVKKIASGDPSPDDEKNTQMPVWLLHPNTYNTVSVQEFPITGPQFDPIAKPDTKRERPMVFPLVPIPQIDLVRIPFKAFDIITSDKNGEQELKIGVITDKQLLKMDQEERKKLAEQFKKNPSRLGGRSNPNGGGFGPGGFGPGGFGPGGPGGGMGAGGRQGGGMGMGMGGMAGTRFNTNEQRTEPTIRYVPLADLDAEMAAGRSPAMTIVPLRGVVIHMEVPYKQQLEEIKRALRLTSLAETMTALDDKASPIYVNGSIYVGYEVQRRVWAINEEGKLAVEIDWPKSSGDPAKDEKYPFEDFYLKYINSRKMADVVEDPYLANFIRPDMSLVLPLPQLVSELGKYPAIKLEDINKAIDKLQKAGVTAKELSDTAKRLSGGAGSNSLYQNQSGSETGASTLYGNQLMNGGGMGLRPQGMGMSGQPPRPGPGPGPGNPGGAADASAIAQDADYLLLRFVDVNIEKNKVYQYRIRLKMKNPNYTRVNDVSNPVYARDPYLYSPWMVVGGEPGQPGVATIDIPPEDFTYALDVATFRKSIEDAYPGNTFKDLRERARFQVRDSQAVVQMCRWMMEVRPETGKMREPVGAWVVADIPVGRGEYVGRKQFIKLPLWSSETKSYHLRDLPASAKAKEINPKGWLIDFMSPDVLVDFTGGKVATSTVVPYRSFAEDAATELLIVSPDGRLTVKKSFVDEADAKRREVLDGWSKWVSEVEKKKDAPAGKDDPNGFNAKPGMQ